MDRNDTILVNLRSQNEALHAALHAQTDINKAIRDELNAMKEIVATHGDALGEMVNRIEETQATIAMLMTRPTTMTLVPAEIEIIEELPVAQPTKAEVESTKTARAIAKANAALAQQG